MNIISGKKENFFKFLDRLRREDKIAIISHVDLDGITSAIVFNEVLKEKKIKYEELCFFNYENGMLVSLINKLKIKGINKIFISDIGIDTSSKEYKNLKRNFEFFIIDHHPLKKDNEKNVIRTESNDCAAFTIFQLINEYTENKIKKLKSLNKLICATMISEFSYKKKENFYFIKKFYPTIKMKNINNSIPGRLSKEVSLTLIYLHKNRKKAFEIVYKNKEKLFKKYYKIVNKEIKKYVKKFNKEKIKLRENLYFCYFNPAPKFSITPMIATIISLKKRDKSIIVCSNFIENPLFIEANARNQGGKEDINLLMKKGVDGLKKASGGGHMKASGAKFLKKDLEKFKKNLLL